MMKQWILPLLRSLLLIAIAVLLLMPVVLSVVSSFMTEREIMANYSMLGKTDTSVFVNLKWIPDWVSFQQYDKVLIATPNFLYLFWNSVMLVAPIIIGQAAVATLASFAFGKLNFPGRDGLFFLYLMTMLMPFQVTLVPNYLMADRLGLLNHPSSIILPGVFGAFGVFLLRQFMLHIHSAYIEAAKMDGAGYWRIFISIALPMVKPGIAALIVLLFVDYWNMVEQPLIFLQDAAMQPLSVFLSRIQEDALGISFAVSVVYMMPMVLLFLSAERYFIEGIQLSGVKG
ncbi:carbohydrate ABC transporter permease [Paenibacillus radicis (ex Gao et al. 2016)]|uniref:Sugar ABC transporter permease n=1 Tax=Paenibacillus radicis (ex Gao et al. 2016) TaxID=1737354 RepID=A0A917GNC9_9BACL|nr:carbohydrate ABC transporter permease [Paenibacillus radicis (ex Gao et al. 2016)]GGG52114.1 sugar ABC transporter permease [Paenibacillus radicis (ex Gao et al. 2016)]